MKKSVFTKIILMIFINMILILSAACTKKSSLDESHPMIVTEDIQSGIEKYIADQAEKGGGYYTYDEKGKRYHFKLVRIHTEYLANLGPGSHFACVDLVDEKGDVYDVDFFLDGDPGAMDVSDTTLHKLNGQPFYSWRQEKNGTWVRVPIDEADRLQLGVITGEDRFTFSYKAKLPDFTGSAEMWIPYPESDRYQSVSVDLKQIPSDYQILTDAEYGNKVLYFRLDENDPGSEIELSFQVKRKEKSAYKADNGEDVSRYLGADALIPADDQFKEIAMEVTQGKNGELVKSRALYDHVIDQMKYAKFGEGWGKGDALYACDSRNGNCTDYHSYFIALARSIGIPARFAIGAAVPSSRNNGGISGYHCWAEFYAEGKWWPIDVSEADKYSALSTYYFGHHPANRIEFSRGRDIRVSPGPRSGPINFLAYPVLEINGELTKVKPRFSFRRIM